MQNITYRVVDGERVKGTWRFDAPYDALTPETPLGEVADEIDRLNDRPDSIGRCRQALDRYLETRTEEDRQALRAAYLAIPEHRRVYTLGDMDSKDHPLVVLCTDLGEPLIAHRSEGPPPVVTEEVREKAFAYFADREAAARAYPPACARRRARDPAKGHPHPPVRLSQRPADRAGYLVGTGDARIHYGGVDSPYWSTGGEAGRNWMGRLLELVRSAEFMIEHVFDGVPRLGP